MAANSTIFAEGFKAEPYWWEAARPGSAQSTDLPSHVDVAIIGSGYAGMSTALELKRNGVDVAILEADELGYGASSRNGGAVSGGVNVGKGGVENKAKLRAMIEEAGEAYAHMEQIIEREAIECHYARVGRFVGAHSPQAYETLAARVAELNEATDSDAEMLPRSRQREEVATDFYYGGMKVGLSGGLHPALFHKGLLAAAERAGVTFCANTRVETTTPLPGGGYEVHTSRGTLTAREVVVATNGYTGTATPWHQRRVIPVASYIIATEDLGEERVRELFPNLRMIADTKRVLYYYRPSPDGRRVLFGGRASFKSLGAVETAPKLHKFMSGVFPELTDVQITHAWTGNVAFTFDRVPHLGEEEKGMHYCLGCNGSGVVMMTHLGHRTALKILGKTNRVSAFEHDTMPTSIAYGGNPWFLGMVGNYYQFRDWLDRRGL